MKPDNEIKPLPVFSGTAMQANMVISLLENAEIKAFLKDQFIGTIAPWYATPGGAGSVKVFVSSLDYDMAKIVVAEYESNIKSNN